MIKGMMRSSLLLGALMLGLFHKASAQLNEKQFEEMMGKYLATDAGQQALGKTMEDYFRKRQEEMKKQQQDMAQKRQEEEKVQFEEQFKKPVKIDIGSSPVKGPADAKVAVIEFSDFQCPFCKKGKDTMEELLKAYPKDVKVVFKHMPLDFHPNAMPAAKASWAAQQQGKFWEFYAVMFDNQSRLGEGEAFYLETAKNLGLNIDKFKKDMASEGATKQIEEDKKLAQANGIQGTPGFFVGGVAVRGAYPIDHFKMIVDRHLGVKK
jgi:protein-disulfide isomerase